MTWRTIIRLWTVRLWDVRTGDLIHTLEGHTNRVYSVSFSPDRQTFASEIRDRTTLLSTVRLWDVSTGDLIHTLTGQKASVYSVSFSPDGQTLATGSTDRTVRLWDVRTGDLIHTLEGHTDWVVSVLFSPDGQTLASTSKDGILLWDVRTGDLIHTLRHTDWVYSVSFSPDGQTLANRSGGEILLWDVRTGDLIHTLTEHTDSVVSVSFSPDGQTLASLSWDDGILLWDVRTGDLIHTLRHADSVVSVAFSPDGQTLASGSNDGTVLLWEITPTSPHPGENAADVNGDGVVDIKDLVAVNSVLLTEATGNNADVNQDGVINIADLVLVAAAIATSEAAVAAAPAVIADQAAKQLTPADVQRWLTQAHAAKLTDATAKRGILFLEHLLSVLTPQKTALLPNYPNPFNPETWIPYQLSEPADVTLTIYDIQGHIVRDLDLGHQAVGMYQHRSRAAYWDGKNAVGEPVASGAYFYTLTAGDFTATRKMLILK